MSSAPSSRPSVPVDLALIRFPLTTEGLPSLNCSHCSESLAIYQPDGYFAERLLGTCGRCGAWYLLDTVPDKDLAVMVLLPDGDYFRKAAGL
jgi:hypothetical protein